jgi:hypothetical protein
MKTIQIDFFSEFVSFVEKNCHDENILFRGQHSDKPLIPKIARIRCKGDLLSCEQQMLNQFKIYSKPYLRRIPANDWEWLSLAQHHGMATRLLDWTINPLAALWFAVQKPAEKKGPAIVWVFNPPEKDILKPNDLQSASPFSGRRTKIFQPDIMTARIQSQGGWFTVHKFLEEKKKQFVPFEENRIYKNALTKIIIPARRFSVLRYHLDRMGTNRMALFPDLDGVACHVEWLQSFDTDEDFGQVGKRVRRKQGTGNR